MKLRMREQETQREDLTRLRGHSRFGAAKARSLTKGEVRAA